VRRLPWGRIGLVFVRAAVLGALLWQTGAGIGVWARELGTWTAYAHWVGAPREPLVLAALRDVYPIFVELRRMVPEHDSLVLCEGTGDAADVRAAYVLASMLWTRNVVVWQSELRLRERPWPAKRTIFFVDLRPRTDGELPAPWEVAHRGEGFTIWKRDPLE
jgi:hypothetical protein